MKRSSALPDPDGLLRGGGAQTRHVELRPGEPLPRAVIERLIEAALHHGAVR